MSVEFRQRTIDEYTQILWKRKWLILLPTIAIAAAISWVALQIPNIYESTTRVVVKPPSIPDALVPSFSDKDLALRLNNITQEVTSRPRLEKLITQYDPYSTERQRGEPMEALIERMKRDMLVKVDTSRNVANAFSISYRGRDPRTTQLITASIASGYVDAQAMSSTNTSTRTKLFFEQQQTDAKGKLNEMEQRRLDFMRENMNNLPSDSNVLLSRLTALYEQRRSLTGEIGRLNDQTVALNGQLNDLKQQSEINRDEVIDQIGDPKSNPAYAQMAGNKARLEAELKAMLQTLKEQNPDVKMKRAEIDSIDQQMQEIAAEGKARIEQRQKRIMDSPDLRINGLEANLKLIAGNINRLQKQFDDTNRQVEEIEVRINRVPGARVSLEALDRDYQTQKDLYNDLLIRQQKADMAAEVATNAQGETIQVLEPANLPQQPVNASKRYLLVGLGVGLGFGVGLLLTALLEVPRMLKIQNKNDAEHYTNLPVLVTIPNLMTAREAHVQRLRRVLLSAAAVVTALVSIPALIVLLRVSHVFERFGT